MAVWIQRFKKPSLKKRTSKKRTPLAILSALLVTFFLPAATKEKVNPYEPKYCQQYTQRKLFASGKKIKHVFFVPDEDVKILLLGLIHMAKPNTKIRIAIYQLTDKYIVEALITAHKRKVIIEIITDQSCVYSRYEKITSLRKLGIPIHVYGGKYYSIMHNKFFVFENTLNGKAIVFTGSANATLGGTTRNEENVWIVENKKIVDQYKIKFDRLKQKISIMPMPTLSKAEQPVYKNMAQILRNACKIIWNF